MTYTSAGVIPTGIAAIKGYKLINAMLFEP